MDIRNVNLATRLTREEHTRLKEAAARSGRKVSEWTREVVLTAINSLNAGLPIIASISSSGGLLLPGKEGLSEVLMNARPGEVIVDPRSVFVIGETLEGDKAILLIDSEDSVLGLLTPGAEAREPLPLARLADFSEVVSGCVAATRKAAIDGTPETVIAAAGDRCYLQTGKGGPVVSLHGLKILLSDIQLLQLQTELCGLVVRETYRGLQQRRKLENLLANEVKTHA